MANVTVTISNSGTPSPPNIQVDHGDTVSFDAGNSDVVLCVDPTALFGAERYEIPANSTLQVVVQNFAPSGPFAYLVITGDLSATCEGGRGDEEGGGEVGGGPG